MKRGLIALTTLLGVFLAAFLGFMITNTAHLEPVETQGMETSAQSLPASEVSIVPSSAPQEESESSAEEESLLQEEHSSIRLAFVGDVLLSDHVLAAYQKGGGISGVLDAGFQNHIAESDFFIANEEFPFSERGSAAADKQFTFRLPPQKVSILKEMQIDLVTLANNHTLDFGTDALVDTLDTLDAVGILRMGAGRTLAEAKQPVIVELSGKKVGFLAASRVIPEVSWNASSTKPGLFTTYDPTSLLEEIGKLRSQCDYLVVYVHWGIERDERPQEYQRSLGKQYIDAGADLVVGSHPHVLQGLEYYKGKPIVYSLGNFVFGSSIPRTALLEVDWDGTDASLRLIPGTSGAGYTRMLSEGSWDEFAEYMTGISYGVTVGADGSVSLP